MELNEKLLKFAGFKHYPEKLGKTLMDYNPAHWVYPDGKKHINAVDFTDPEFGIAYCFKWLVPKVSNYFIGSSVEGHTATVWNISYSYEARAETPTLALCKAIEKLIDGSS